MQILPFVAALGSLTSPTTSVVPYGQHSPALHADAHESAQQDVEKRPVLGIGGGAGGRFGGRFASEKRLVGTVDEGAQPCIDSCLDWLVGKAADAPPRAQALTILAVQGDGQFLRRGERREELAALTRALADRVDKIGRIPSAEPDDDETLTHLLGALLVASELNEVARLARIDATGLGRIEKEVDRRIGLESPCLLVEALAVTRTADDTERTQRANAPAARAILEPPLKADVSAADALRVWWVSDALRAGLDEAWTKFGTHRHWRLVDLQQQEGDRAGSWEVAPEAPGPPVQR